MTTNNKLIILALVILSYVSCSPDTPTSDAYGNFEATATIVSAETSGKLVSFTLAEGTLIEADQVVARVDTTQLHLQKMQIQASINTLPQKLRNTIDDIRVLQERKANLERERDRTARLIERNAATQKQLDDITGEIEVIDQQVNALKTQTQTANAAILSEKGPLIAQMEIINDQIRRSTIYNPIRGTVLTKMAEQYEIMRAGAPLYRIAAIDTMTFKFYVDAVQLQDLALGHDVEILIDEGESAYESLTGRISWISDEAEFTPRTIQTKEDRVNLVYAVKARVPNSDGRLKIGMPGEVNFSK